MGGFPLDCSLDKQGNVAGYVAKKWKSTHRPNIRSDEHPFVDVIYIWYIYIIIIPKKQYNNSDSSYFLNMNY